MDIRFTLLDVRSDAELAADAADREWARWSSLSKEEQRLEALKRGIGATAPITRSENLFRVVLPSMEPLIALVRGGRLDEYWRTLFGEIDRLFLRAMRTPPGEREIHRLILQHDKAIALDEEIFNLCPERRTEMDTFCEQMGLCWSTRLHPFKRKKSPWCDEFCMDLTCKEHS